MNIGVAAALAKALGGGGGSSPSGGGLVVPHFTVRQIDAANWECTCDKTYSELRSAYEQNALVFGIANYLSADDPTVAYDIRMMYLYGDYGDWGFTFIEIPDVSSDSISQPSIDISSEGATYFYQEYLRNNS